MKLIVAGSRTLSDAANRQKVYDYLDGKKCSITEIVSGMALSWKWKDDPHIGGADRYGYDWAIMNAVPVMTFYPDWERYGKGAGINRNCDMARYADAVVVFFDGSSTGTDHMKIMQTIGKPVLLGIDESECGWFE